MSAAPAQVPALEREIDTMKEATADKMQLEDRNDDEAENDGEEEENDDSCPLFMVGLPKDFSVNPSLAALASLLDDSGDEKHPPEEKKGREVVLKPGGGKLRAIKSRNARKAAPYRAPKKTTASMGEAQLFMKMWKL